MRETHDGPARDIGRHFGPYRNGGLGLNPATDLLQQLAVLAHGHAHAALGHAVRAAEVDLKAVHASRLAAFYQLLPCGPVILLHNRRYQHPATGAVNAVSILPCKCWQI